MNLNKKTFRERIKESYQKTINKNYFLRLPAFLFYGILLVLYTLVSGWKKYAFTSFLLINIIITSSFTYPVFGTRDGFISGEVQIESIAIGESTIELRQDFDLADDDEIFEEDEGRRDFNEYDSASLADILEERDLTEAENFLLNENAMEADIESPENIEFSADDWRLILINKQHPVPEDYEYVLGTIKGNMKCDARIIDELLLMMQKAQDEGIELVIISPHRDFAHQEFLFNRKINAYMRQGLSYLEAYKRSATTVNVPGTSEHQVGLAIDITSREYRNLDIGFADTKAGEWLARHSYEYGFILRYPLGKEYITGIQFEPWHFRYVGKEAAKVIYEEQLTLEEFIEKYVF